MKKLFRIAAACAILSAMGTGALAAERRTHEKGEGEAKKKRVNTVEAAYPGLAVGALTFAVLSDLPGDLILQTEDLRISEAELKQIVAWEPESLHFFVFERTVADRILVPMAKAALKKEGKETEGKSDRRILDAYFDKAARKASVTDKDVSRFYAANKKLFGGASIEQSRPSIRSHLAMEKKHAAISEIVRELGNRLNIKVSSSWAKKQAEAFKTGPVEKMRASGKPSVVAFSGATCCGPDLVKPVLDAIGEKYGDNVNVMYVEPRRELTLAERYDVQVIPTVVIYDKSGAEIFRHTGDVTIEQIEEPLDKAGKIRSE